MLFYMRTQDWLYNYQFPDGIKNSFQGLVRRASYIHEHETAFRLFEEHYTALGSYYSLFFPTLKNFAQQEFNKLLDNNF
jgi:acyl carrier protein phosphodiesterase